MSNQSQQYHDQIKADVDIRPFVAWFDKQISLHKQAILRWPQERETFKRLIKLCEQSKQKMINEHQATKQRVLTAQQAQKDA